MFFKLRALSRLPLIGLFFSVLYRLYNILYGASIPLDVKISKSTKFPHGIHGVFISKSAILGNNITIFHHVTIGSNQIGGHELYGAPNIGDNVFIGAGVKVIGNISIGKGCVIATNVSLSRDVPSFSGVYPAALRVICIKQRL